MRIKLDLEPDESFPFYAVGKHAVQAMIYTHLSGTEYESLHDRRGFKFFTFSDIFPSGRFQPGERKSLIISSPDGGFIETLYERLLPNEKIYLGRHALNVVSIKKFSLRPGKAFITGSPVVLSAPGRGRFFTFHHHRSLPYFIEKLTENAIKKYEAFTGESLTLDSPIFTAMVPRLRKKGWFDIYVRVNIRGRYFDVPGTTWEYLEAPINLDNREFYSFLMDAGIGELNSLGFGFINPLRGRRVTGGAS
ncbi:CRISPR-associated protein Cas6 [Thermococcus celericrescens]|uniref:CRISPR-associated protein Cas6 n=1 Tax=Thermococcus celericrescens TaxID=227598 RepID=A0A100XYP3_9EURY|nr:CRISPR-associated endoribonuclease Cas6 [Thermococcus celericrescens]KUH33945.1 CRISPR-associated protein Cas6 [Thermococcus celericrescens]